MVRQWCRKSQAGQADGRWLERRKNRTARFSPAMPRCDRRAISWGERKGGGAAAVSTDRRSCRM